MGASSSKDEKLAAVPVRFGEPGETGLLTGVFHDHNLTSATRVGDRRNALLAVSRSFIDVYNPETGDRRVRLRATSNITCCDYGFRSMMGPVLVVGTSSGLATIYELTTHTPFRDVRTVELDVAAGSRTGLFPTAVLCHPSMRSDTSGGGLGATADQEDVFFAGNSDGSVAAFSVTSGDLARRFNTPATEPLDSGSGVGGATGGRSNEVVSLAVLEAEARPVLAVAHINGDLHTFDATSGQWLSHMRVAPNVTRVVAASVFNTLLVSHDDKNSLVLWDLTTDQTLKLDFTQELNAVGKRKAKMTFVTFDNARNVIFAGASDGSVFVRRLERSAAGSFGVKLLRYCNPSRTATTPSRISCMWYDTALDRMHTGDMSGLVRVVKKVSGIPFEATAAGESAVKSGRYRARTGSGVGAGTGTGVGGSSGAGFGGGAGGAAGAGFGGGAGGGVAGDMASAGPPLPEQWRVDWAGGSVAVSALGGMVVPKFLVPGGQHVSPLFVAPWAQDPQAGRLPPILRALRGEFACVPFGSARPVVGLTPEWALCKREEAEGPHSGHGANTTWTLESRSATSLVASCEYPGHHPVRVLRKRVHVEGNAVAVQVEVHCRAATSLPLGVSAMFAVSPRVGATTLVPGSFEFGSVFPGTFEPSGKQSFTLSPGASFDSLSEVPRRVPPGPGVDGDGADVPQDLSEVPLADTTVEAVVQLCGSDGAFHVVRHDLGCTFTLAWDPSVLPSTLVHVSNNGRKYYPWSGAHSSVTVSPVASAFDLGTAVSAADNPLQSRGVDTTVDVEAGGTVVMEYTLSVTKGTTPPADVPRLRAPAVSLSGGGGGGDDGDSDL